MMTSVPSVNPDSFLMAASLNNVSKDRRLMAAGASCMEKLLGFSPQNLNSNSAASDAGDLNELKEEDVWGIWPDAGSSPAQYETKEENFQSRHKTDSGSNGGSNGGGNGAAVEPGRSLQSGSIRRWKEAGGLSVAFEESNRSRLSPLTRSSAFFSVTPGNRISVRMIPSADQNGNSSSGNGSNNSSNNRHVMMMHHQSAPVNVPDWSKILGVGMDSLKDNSPNLFFSAAADEDDDGSDMLPPHEYLAREQAQSQMTTTSVFEGVGRTLKGRDMSRVRNTVWRQTGFLG